MNEEETVEVEETQGETLEAQEEVESPETSTEEEVDLEELRKKAEIAENYKIRAEKAEKALKKASVKGDSPKESIDSIELVKLGKKLQDYSDEEIDFAMDVAKSKDPKEILTAFENPFVQAGINSIREKVEKEKLSVKPSGTQPESDAPQSFMDKFARAKTVKEQQEILEEFGLYNEPKHNPNRRIIRP